MFAAGRSGDCGHRPSALVKYKINKLQRIINIIIIKGSQTVGRALPLGGKINKKESLLMLLC